MDRQCVGIQQFLVTNDEDTLPHARQPRVGALRALDDQRAGSASQDLSPGHAVHVRVIPIQPGRLLQRNPESIHEGARTRLNPRIEHVVLVTDRRHVQAMKVYVGRGGGHGPGAARTRRRASVARHAIHRASGSLLVLDGEDQQVARLQAQRGRFAAVPGYIAVVHPAVGIDATAIRQVDAQHTVDTAQILRFSHFAAGGRALRATRMRRRPSRRECANG